MRALVDARGRPYTWSIRRLGEPGVIRGSGRKTKFALNIHAPRGAQRRLPADARTAPAHTTTGAGARSRAAATPAGAGRAAVHDLAGPQPGRRRRRRHAEHARPRRRRARRAAVRRQRPAGGLPAREAPTISWLDHTHRSYDITTDLALALGQGPQARRAPGRADPRRRALDHAGASARSCARSCATAGGSPRWGPDSLQRRVRISPQRPAVRARRPRRRRTCSARSCGRCSTARSRCSRSRDDLQLFAGHERHAGPVRRLRGDAARSGREADLASDAVIASGGPLGRPVVVAVDFGKGKVIRTGLPELPDRLSAGGNVSDADGTDLDAAVSLTRPAQRHGPGVKPSRS